jgi:hypothetical protein
MREKRDEQDWRRFWALSFLFGLMGRFHEWFLTPYPLSENSEPRTFASLARRAFLACLAEYPLTAPASVCNIL